MSNREHTLTIDMLKELDALYEETEDMGALGDVLLAGALWSKNCGRYVAL